MLISKYIDKYVHFPDPVEYLVFCLMGGGRYDRIQ